MSGFTSVCRMDDIPRLGARVLERGGNGQCNVAVFRTADDQVFAVDDRCPHKGGPLSQGIVHGDRVSCPLHGWNIALDSGRAIAPDEGCAARHEVRIDDGWVMIRLDAAPIVS